MERMWTVVRATWNWLWGKPLDGGGAISLQAGEDSVDDLAEVVNSFIDAASQQKAALSQAEKLYLSTSSDVERLQKQAEAMLAQGDEEAALSLLAEQDVIDDYLPQLESQVAFAEQTLDEITKELKEAQLNLKKAEAQQRLGGATLQITQALEKANKAAGIDSRSAMKRFERSQSAIKGRNIKAQAVNEVQSSLKGTDRKIRSLGAAERLKALKAQQAQKRLNGETKDNG